MVYARPLIPLLIAMICGIGIGECFKPGIRLIFPLIPLISALLAQRIYRRRTSGILPLLLFFSVGLCLIIPFASPPFPPHHISFYTDTHRYDIMGRIVSPPVRKNARWQFILKTESLTDKRGAFPVCGNIRVTAREMPYDLSVGDRISFPGKIRAIRNFNNPGRFDYHRYMAF